MNLKESLREALGDDYTPSDEIIIERLVIYYEIFKEASGHLKKEGGYRRNVAANAIPGVRNGNERYNLHIGFGVMNECAKQIRADLEMLGLSKKGKKLEITTKVDKGLTLLEQMNDIKDDE